MHLGALTTQASPRRARQSAVAAVLQIGTCDVDSTPYRAFFRAPPYGDMSNRVPPYGAIQTSSRKPPLPKETGRTTFQNGRRQREPEGRSPARTRRQGRAKRMPRQGGLRVGVGGAVQSNRTTQPTQDPPPPNTRGSASPQGEARRERAGKAAPTVLRSHGAELL